MSPTIITRTPVTAATLPVLTPLDHKLQALKQQLSAGASIMLASDAEFQRVPTRWNAVGAPTPGAVVSMGTEEDVQVTVAWAVANDVPFAAQAGGHSHSVSGIGRDGIIVNMRPLHSVVIDAEAGEAVIEAGCLIGEVLEAAAAKNVDIALGAENTVGAVSSTLGGGLGRMQGLYGLGVDNMVSVNMVTAQGRAIQVSATENAELWWAVRGAGQNFGIVTRLTMKVYPAVNNGMHWFQLLVFDAAKITQVVEVLNRISLAPEMALKVFFGPSTSNPAQPTFFVNLFYAGPEAAAQQAWAPIIAANPIFTSGGVKPFIHHNGLQSEVLLSSGRRACRSTTLKAMSPSAVANAWSVFSAAWAKHPEIRDSMVTIYCYPTAKSCAVASADTAYPHRGFGISVMCMLNYTASALDAEAKAFSKEVQAIFRDGVESRVYVNFAQDEPLEEMYGNDGRLEKLRELKADWDPEARFSVYHPF